jgi:hypothetical protein
MSMTTVQKLRRGGTGHRKAARGRAPGALLGLALAAGCNGAVAPGPDDPGAGGEGGAAGGGSTGRTPGPPGGGAMPGAGGAAGAVGGGPAPDGGVAATDGRPAAPPPAPGIASPRVAISEIMYHPVLAHAEDNDHEFVEIHNPGAQPVALDGWKLTGEIQFTFPPRTTIAPGQFLVVAKKRARLLEVAKYNLGPLAAQVLGDFAGLLDDGGGRIVLADGAGAIVDHVTYDDRFPWPLAADAFGAGDGWFEENEWFPAPDPRKSFLPHKYMGHSLERVSFTVPATAIANWVPSPIDGATPGRAGSVTGTPPAIVEELGAGPERDPASRVIRAGEKIVVRARLTAGSPADKVELEHYVDYDKGRKVAAPAPARIAMTRTAAGWEATLPGFAERTVVRYRITAERRAGAREVISPRPTDPIPYGHHLLYVSAAIPGKTYYEILVSPENWGRMWTNISPNGLVMGCASNYGVTCQNCMENANWNARVAAVFASGGEAYDARTRYNGSAEGRTFGVDIGGWPADAPRPTAGPVRALSWSVSFPKYRRFENMPRITLNRLYQSCPGFSTFVAHHLYEDERGGRVPAPKVRRWARLFVNGVPYNYVMDIEPIDEQYLERFHGKGQTVGDVFKLESDGNTGPYGVGSGDPIGPSPFCPAIPVKTRYERTYNRNSNDWRGPEELIALVEGLAAARTQGAAKVKEYLEKNFDVDLLLKSYAVHQWGAPWDDWGKNYNVYKLPPQDRKPGKGAWVITPWDEDRMYGVMWCGRDGCARANITIYCGTGTTGDARLPSCNRWKRAVMDALRAEYGAKLKELNETLLRPEVVRKLADEALAAYDVAEARQMLARPSCDAAAEAANVRLFAERRYQAVKTQLGY